MSEKHYLIKMQTSSGSRGMVQVETVRVTHPKRPIVEVRNGMNYQVGSTPLTKQLQFMAAKDSPSIMADGRPSGWRHDYVAVPRTAAGVKSALRRVRPDEAAELATIDEEIAALTERLQQLRERRAAVVRTAWTKGHVVRLAEVEAMLEKEDA